MKKILLLIAVEICIMVTANAQERVDGTTAVPKLLKSSAYVSNITGWAYDSYKERWCGYKNVMYHEYKNNNKVATTLSPAFIAKKQYFGWIRDNIINIQTKKYSFDGRDYYMFLVSSWGAYYDYPTLQQGFHYVKTVNIYITTEEEYLKIKDVTEEKSKITIRHLGGTPKRDEWFPSYRSINEALMDNFHDNDTTIIKEIAEYEKKENKMYSECGFLYFKKEGNNIRFSPFCVEESDFMYEHYEVRSIDWEKLFL